LPTKAQLLEALARSDWGCYLESNGAPDRDWDWIIAIGAKRVFRWTDAPDAGDPLEALAAFRRGGASMTEAPIRHSGKPATPAPWLFGGLAFDLKNPLMQAEKQQGRLSSGQPDPIGLPDALWFEPQCAYGARMGRIEVLVDGPWPAGTNAAPANAAPGASRPSASTSSFGTWRADLDQAAHTDAVEAIRRHIRDGDVYEINLCAQFQHQTAGPHAALDTSRAFADLNARTQAPFAAQYKLGGVELLCASPERFLQVRGRQLRSQPIKGTAPRNADAEADRALAARLAASEKDRAENLMIVDLVRNDFARVCDPGTIRVPEICGVHHFPTVHHLISTVEGRLSEGKDAIDAIRHAFPMGSMTGAPKLMALELIERYERHRRGWYSGSVGWLSPEGDLDLNVVIRSLLYRHDNGTACVSAGGAITWDSDPTDEWAELLVKAAAVKQTLANAAANPGTTGGAKSL
jgi:para-aminobenzoate synthetase component 1